MLHRKGGVDLMNRHVSSEGGSPTGSFLGLLPRNIFHKRLDKLDLHFSQIASTYREHISEVLSAWQDVPPAHCPYREKALPGCGGKAPVNMRINTVKGMAHEAEVCKVSNLRNCNSYVCWRRKRISV